MEKQWPSHHKLLARMLKIGPYLRKERCQEHHYFFDCLAACTDANPPADEREFYGWWFEVEQATEGTLNYSYRFGLHSVDGQWTEQDIPDEHHEQVKSSLLDFYPKLHALLADFDLKLEPSSTIQPQQILPAA